MEILKTTKGKPCIIVDGFQYNYCYRNRFNVISWRCSKHRRNCHSRTKTLDGKVISVSEHTCKLEEAKTEVKKAVLRARERALDTNVPLLEIYKEEVHPLTERGEDFAAKIPSAHLFSQNIKRVIRRNSRRGLVLSSGNEQDANSSDSNNKEETENRPADDTKKQKEAASSPIPSDESSAAGPSNVTPQYELKEKERFVNIPSVESSAAGPSNVTPQYELKEKKRFVNIAFFVKSLKNLNSHGGDGCTLSDMNISGEIKNGWNAGIKLSCSVCLFTVIVWMEDPYLKSVNSQPSVPSAASNGTDTEKQLTSEKIPTKKRRFNNRKTTVQPTDSLVQKGCMVQPTDPQVQQTMVPPANHLVHLQSMVPPTLAEPFGPQSDTSPNQGWSHNPLHLIHSQMPKALARPFIRSQINSSHQNRTLNPKHSGHPHFLVPQSNSPQQGWRHNSLHSINQFVMQPQISSSFVPQSDSSPDQYRLYNPPPSSNTHHMVPPPLARPFLMPQSNTVHQNETDILSHSINSHSINQTSFVKQELVASEDDASSSINQVPKLSTQPSCVQLFFSVEPSENSNTIPESADESTALTPEETLPSCQTFSTTGLENNQNLANFKNETIVPEKMPTDVLPIDLNLVKEEIEDESQSMEFSVCLVPHSEVSLNHSEAPFGSESNIKAKISTDSTLMNTETVMPSTIDAPVSDSLGAQDCTVSSYLTSP